MREREGNKLISTNLAIVHSLDIYRDSLDIYREAKAESLDITIPDIFFTLTEFLDPKNKYQP